MADLALSDITAITMTDTGDDFYIVRDGNSRRAPRLGFTHDGTDAVARFLEDKLREVARSTTDYGATGDGVTSDSAAFGAAYNATPEDGLLIIPQGTYEISSAIFDSDTKDFTVVAEPGVVFNSSTDMDNAFKGRLRPTNLLGPLLADSWELSSKEVTGTWAHKFYYWNVVDDGSTTASEKIHDFRIVNNRQSQDTNTQDVVICDWRIETAATNTNGNSFNIFLQNTINSGGDGVMRGIEIGMENEGSAVSGVDSAKNKKAINLLADGSNPCTAAVYVGGATGFYKGLYSSSTGIANDSSSSFLEFASKFRVNYDGWVAIGSATANRQVYVEVNDAATSGATVWRRLTHNTSATAASGFGLATEYELENGSGSKVVSGLETLDYTTVTSGSEVARWRMALSSGAGSRSDALTVTTAACTALTSFAINGTKVVGARDTGWAAMTGSADEGTTYDTSTVTTAQLAGRVMALQAALTTHGLIGA